MPNHVPQLKNYVSNALNAKTGDFLSKPVFVLSYDMGKTVHWGSASDIRDIPDQIAANTVTTHYSKNHSLTLQNKADYDRSFSISIGAEYSGVSFSGSARSSLFYHGSLFSDVASTNALNFYVQTVLAFERLSDDLDPQFEAALGNLPQNPGSPDAYYDFFDEYGTHYVHAGTMGGVVVVETTIENSLFETFSELEVEAAISAGYRKAVSSGKLDVEAIYNASSFLSEHRNAIQIDINVTGGLYNPAGILSEWFHSIYNTPSILLNLPGMADDSFTSLRPISDLAGNAAVAANINRLLTHYLAKTDNEDGLFTTPKEVNLGHVYNASSGAGFVVGNLQATANGDRSVLRAYDAHNDNPTDIRATASQHFYTQSDHYIYASSLSMPTPMGTHFTVEGEITFGRPSMTAKIIGIGNSDDNALTPYADVALNQKLTAPSDGFVVAWVTGSNAENVASTIVGKQWISGQAVAVAGSSQHWWPAFDIHVPTNSFCMPVRKNTEYEVTLQTNGAPVAKAAFVGVSDDFELQTSSARKHNRVYTAQTDGFLTAFIQTNGNGDRAMVNVFANPNESLLAKHSPFAETSVHDYDGSHIAVPYNTVTVPIAKGSYYKAEFVPTWGSPSITLNWTPFVIKKT